MPEGGDQNGSPSSNWPVEQGSQDGDAESFFNRGLDQHDQGLYDEAIESYKRAVELDPDFVVANNNLGMVYIDKEMFPEAIAAFDRTIELDPGYAEAHNNLGFVYRRLGDDAKAAVHYTKFIELEPDVEDASKIQSWIDKFRSAEKEAPAEPAPSETEPEPPSAPPSESPAPPPAAATDSGGEPSAADPWAGPSTGEPATPEAPPSAPPVPQATSAPPAGPPPGLPPQQPAAVQPPPPSALPAATAPAAPPEETAEAVCEKGIAEFEAGRLEQAEEILRRAATMNPGLAVARSALGRVLAKADRHDEAVEELKAAVSLDPTDAAAYYVLGFALRSSGQDHDAADAYERYLELTPDASEGPQIRSWIEEVQAAGLTPTELYHRALTSFQDGALDEALEACEGALAADETDPQSNILMGRILIQKGDSIHAVAVLKRAQRRNPDDPEACFYLGQAYEKRGLMDDARQAYEQCLAVAPAGPQAEAVRGWLEKARGAGDAPSSEARCEYCFRGFPDDQLSRHEGKRICRDCLKNLGLAEAPAREAKVIQHAGVERVAAAEAARAERQRLGARIFRWILTGVLGLFLVLGLLLLCLRSGWLEGPLRSIGVHGAIRALGLEDLLARYGIHLRPKQTGDGPTTPGGKDPTHGTGVPQPTKPLALAGPDGPVGAAPFGPLELRLRPEGGKGDYRF
ncbi:MAG: tetratricopeptide repeat protein, partial [Planctomycetota bacterium]